MRKIKIALEGAPPETLAELLREHGYSAEIVAVEESEARSVTGQERANEHAEHARSVFPDAEYCIGIDRVVGKLYTITWAVVLPRGRGESEQGHYIRHKTVSPRKKDPIASDIKDAIWSAMAQLLDREALSGR